VSTIIEANRPVRELLEAALWIAPLPGSRPLLTFAIALGR